MKSLQFRRLKISDQLDHLIEQACLKLENFGFTGVSIIVKLGGHKYHIVVDSLYLHSIKDSSYLKRIKEAKEVCLRRIKIDGEDCKILQSSRLSWLETNALQPFWKKVGGKGETTWGMFLQRLGSIKLDKYKARDNCFIVVNGVKCYGKNNTRNAVVALLSKFLVQLDAERFDYLLEVVDYYDAFIALSEGSLTKLPNCKLSKKYLDQGEKNE